MLAKDFWYDLPADRIAQEPAKPRDTSKLMVLDSKTRSVRHAHFFDLPNFLRPGDLLVANDSKVFKARLQAGKNPPPPPLTGGSSNQIDPSFNRLQPSLSKEGLGGFPSPRFEIFLLRPDVAENDCWIALAKPGRKLAVQDTLVFAEGVQATVVEKTEDGTVKIRFGLSPEEVFAFTDKHGEVPTPPYVEHAPTDPDDYQTVYAKKTGSAAAPTAGFHFTPELIDKLKSMGVGFANVTLHVGLGTFRPMKTEKVEDHEMHEEWIDVPQATVEAMESTKRNGGRVIAVGTTTVRALESGIQKGFTKIFITPGFEFKKIDALITNFHLPESTLLVLVSAFAQFKIGPSDNRTFGPTDADDRGREFVLEAYRQAVEKNYRFFSFGDAMLIN